MAWENWIFGIPKLEKVYFNKINNKDKPKIAHILAWIYTIFTVIFILIIIGIIIHFGAKYEIPVIDSMGNFLNIKYLSGADKFSVKMNDPIEILKDQNKTIKFMINSYKDGLAWITVYLKPYEDYINIPSFNYPKEKVLTVGESNDNSVDINIFASNYLGNFQICIIIDDRTFFGINKYEDCPSVLKIIN